jgi:Na+-translocating ferredoxin:NAD+ oxidoreductase subunit B
MMMTIIIALSLICIWIVQSKYRLADFGERRVSENDKKQVLFPAFQFRSRNAWCEFSDSQEGYSEKSVAVVNCLSTSANNQLAFRSQERSSCLDMHLQHGGERACAWACLGEADCVEDCPEEAIVMRNGLPLIDSETCTGCGDCVKSCPRQVISLLPADSQIFNACGSAENRDLRMTKCEKGCHSSNECLSTKFVEENMVIRKSDRTMINYTRSSNLLPLKALCPSGVFRDRISFRPWFSINDFCTGCNDCLPTCPVENCIVELEDSAGNPRVKIVPDLCIGCGICLPACEVNAIRVVGALGYDLASR